MTAFIRVTEIWVPSLDGTALEYGGGLYGPLLDFKAASENSRFMLDEGLPGKAWASRRPVILKEFHNSYFLRAEAAAAAGLTCGVALPVFSGETLKAVVVFLCGSDEEHVGAIELWKFDPAVEAQIGLVDGYYGTAELFEWTSRHIKYGKGSGLPGLVWQSGMPLIINEIFRPGQFLRSEVAQKVGLSTGLGIPGPFDSDRIWIMTFLSALGTPIARRFEIWTPGVAAGSLKLQSGFCESNAQLAKDYADVQIAAGDGMIGRTLLTSVPTVIDGTKDEPAWLRSSLDAAGLSQAVAIPVLRNDGATKAIVVWYF